MSEMIERGARAICRSLEVTEDSWRDHADEARAVIEAIREPPVGYDKIVYHGEYADDVWRDMIDKALK